MTKYIVKHIIKKQRFEIALNNETAVLEYHLNSHTINFHKTFVPENLRGKKLAFDLVNAGLAWAKEKGLKIEADCWFAEKVIKQYS